jgi:hypothetical protein
MKHYINFPEKQYQASPAWLLFSPFFTSQRRLTDPGPEGKI